MLLANKLSLANPIHLISLGFGSGLAPKAPGTFGTLAAIPLLLLVGLLQFNWWQQLILLVVMTLVGIACCAYSAKAMGVHDHPAIVWDEIVGYFIAMYALPHQWPWLLAAFVLFRILDISKPGPVGWCDRQLHGGSGIMLDDVVAGILTALILHGAALIL